MALTQAEWVERRVEEAHHALNGHRRASWWPDVPKHQVNLAICETPSTHVWEEVVTVKLKDRAYDLSVSLCKNCPLHLTNLVVKEQKAK